MMVLLEFILELIGKIAENMAAKIFMRICVSSKNTCPSNIHMQRGKNISCIIERDLNIEINPIATETVLKVDLSLETGVMND